MVAHVNTVTLSGINAVGVDVQVQITSGLQSFQIVGLPDNAVRESRERVRGAFYALGIALPSKRITINLAPADLAKEGSLFDLPIAIGLLIALKIIPQDTSQNSLFMGELGLDGSLIPVTGALPAAIHASSSNLTNLFVPLNNAREASWADGLNVYGANNLQDIINHITGETTLSITTPKVNENNNASRGNPCFSDVKGQESAKRAAEIAAAGGHNMLMCGPPGAGKSMIAQRLVGIMPALSPKEALEVSMIHSVAGQIGSDGLVSTHPFRDPHHSASAVALCGGGIKAKPGEMSLSHRGILFLDELPEFPRQVLETLRQPLETGNVTVSRANHHVTYPARFQLIAAMNPCPCGYDGHPSIACSDSHRQVLNYRNKISGPLMDRIDLHISVPVVNIKDLSLKPAKETSEQIAIRVKKARDLQTVRFGESSVYTNAELSSKQLEEVAKPGHQGQKMLEAAGDKFALSARGYHRVLRTARTIADLEGSENIRRNHIAEALGYRYIPYQLR